MKDDYAYIMDALSNGEISKLAEIAQIMDDFPEGCDTFTGRRWITNAIDIGSKRAIRWLLSQKVALNFVDDEGFSPLHSAIDRENSDRYDVIKRLLENGADPNLHGFNDWTVTHLAAARDDVKALALLVEYGADLNIRTRIDDYNTPFEEAQLLKNHIAVEFLRQFE